MLVVSSALYSCDCLMLFQYVVTHQVALLTFIFTSVSDSTVSSDYVGSFQAATVDGTTVDVDVSEGDSNYFYCDQDMMHYSPPAFPAIPSNQPVGGEWMSESQQFCSVFGWTSVFIVVYVLGVFLNALRKRIIPIFFRVYEVRTQWLLCRV